MSLTFGTKFPCESTKFFIEFESFPDFYLSFYFRLHTCCPDGKDNAFTRSRSSSVTSIDRESREAISSFYFCESFPRKSDSQVSPCLLVGTTQGSVMMVALSMLPGGDQKPQQPVGFASCGKKHTRCHSKMFIPLGLFQVLSG